MTPSLNGDLISIETSILKINGIILLSSNPPQKKLEYILNQSEKDQIERLYSTITDATIQVSLQKVKVFERTQYNYFDNINEKVNNSSGTKISFILGDELSTNGVSKFLKDQGVNKIEDINFVELSKIFNDKTRELSTNEVNKNAIIRIQQGVAKIIYHVTKTPDNVGINPGTGGGVTETPTSLMNPWKKKVETVKSQFRMYLNVDQIDPFVVNVSDYSSKEDPGNKKLKDSDESIKEINRVAQLVTPKGLSGGFKKKTPKTDGDINLIRLNRNGKYFGPVFKLQDDVVKIFEYQGSINLDLVSKHLESNDIDTTNISQYITPFPKYSPDNGIPDFLKQLMNTFKNNSDGELTNIYFVFDNPISTPSSGGFKKNPAKIFFLFVKNGGITNGNVDPTKFSLYYVKQDCTNILKISTTAVNVDDPILSKLNLVKSIDIGIGESFFLETSICKLIPTPTPRSARCASS